ncbi:MAG TPA: ABC transporter permease [Bacteroidales bacterium]|nr:ABC transporter permease [Bacteroidales bacterium]
MQFFFHTGRYLTLIALIFKKPERANIYRKQIIIEMDNLGLQSLGLVAIISIFMGAVLTLQTAFNTEHPLLPIYAVGAATRQAIILEFSPTIISLVLAGKLGSRIASEIGTMRITEQIDALEIMGVNAAGYLILPKVIASLILNPILIIISMFLGIFGGWLAVVITNVLPLGHYVYGILFDFALFDVFYALIKTIVFAFIITTISGYYGFFTKGGALEVGQSSTKAVVMSSIFILLFNLLLTQLLLT